MKKAALAGAASVARAAGLHLAALADEALAIIVSRRAAIAFLGSPVGLVVAGRLVRWAADAVPMPDGIMGRAAGWAWAELASWMWWLRFACWAGVSEEAFSCLSSRMPQK